VSENGDVLTGRLIMPFNSQGGSAGILADLLARSAPDVVVRGLDFFSFILELLLPSLLKLWPLFPSVCLELLL